MVEAAVAAREEAAAAKKASSEAETEAPSEAEARELLQLETNEPKENSFDVNQPIFGKQLLNAKDAGLISRW